MALPKRRHSRSRRDKSRTHQKLSNPSLSVCSQCGQEKLTHRVCPYCGYYKGKKVIDIKVKEEEKK